MAFNVGDVVYAVKDVIEYASGDAPGGRLCKFGDKLIVREVCEDREYKYIVSHETVTDGTGFAVTPTEISAMRHFDHNYTPPFRWVPRFGLSL